MELHINGAEIRSKMFLKYNYEEHRAGRKTVLTANCDAPIHEDLRTAFQKLIPHFLLLTEMKNKPEVVKKIDLDQPIDEELLKKYKVKSFSIEEKNGDQIVQISGLKHLNTGKSISFSTPKIGPGTKDNEYEFYDKMITTVENLQEEIMEYIEGKQAERAQGAIDFSDDAGDFDPEEDTETETVTETETEDFIPA